MDQKKKDTNPFDDVSLQNSPKQAGSESTVEAYRQWLEDSDSDTAKHSPEIGSPPQYAESPHGPHGPHRRVLSDSPARPSALHKPIAEPRNDPRAYLEQPIIGPTVPRIKPARSMPPEPIDKQDKSPSRFLNMPKQLVKQMSLRNLPSLSPSYRTVGRTLTSQRLKSTSPQSAPIEYSGSMDSLFASATRQNRLRHAERIKRTPVHPSLVEVNMERSGQARAPPSKPEIKEESNAEWEYHRMDAGRGWECVLWAFLCNLGVGSAPGTFAAFQVHYQDNASQRDPAMLDESAHATHALTKASLTYISLIGALLMAVCAAASGMAGAFSDRTGPRASALTGAFVSALALLVGSYSDDLRMLSIVQGAVQGVGVALVVVPAYVVPAHWFERHRALASGLSLAGTALGTACLTPALHALLSRHGMQTAMRVQALVALVSGSVGSAGLQTRVAVARPRKITWKVFYDMRLAVLALVALLAGASLTLQLLCLPGFAHLLGMAERLHAVYALGAAACVGLVAGGLVADRTGYIAGIGLSQLAMGVFTLALWLPARGPAVFFAYVVCYGLAIGVLGAVLPASIMQMFGIARAFTMLGIATMAAAVGVLATLPMAVEFQQRASQNRSVQFLIGIGGGLSILAGIAALLLPYLQRRHLVRVLNKSVWVE